jgi:hypothetical protein
MKKYTFAFETKNKTHKKILYTVNFLYFFFASELIDYVSFFFVNSFACSAKIMSFACLFNLGKQRELKKKNPHKFDLKVIEANA